MVPCPLPRKPRGSPAPALVFNSLLADLFVLLRVSPSFQAALRDSPFLTAINCNVLLEAPITIDENSHCGLKGSAGGLFHLLLCCQRHRGWVAGHIVAGLPLSPCPVLSPDLGSHGIISPKGQACSLTCAHQHLSGYRSQEASQGEKGHFFSWSFLPFNSGCFH